MAKATPVHSAPAEDKVDPRRPNPEAETVPTKPKEVIQLSPETKLEHF